MLGAPIVVHADDLFVLSDKSGQLPVDELNNVKDTLDVELADIDADGDLDALVANLGANQSLINDGTGVFTERSLPQATPPGTPGFFISLAPGAPPIFIEVSAEALFIDIDGDTDQDIVIANENPFPFGGPAGDQNRLLLNDGTGHFNEATERLPTALDNSSGIAAGDINADGHLDPLEADIEYEHDSDTDAITQFVHWEGAMDPDSAVKFTFEVHVHSICQVIDDTVFVLRLSQAKAPGEDVVETLLSYDAACSGYGTSNIDTTPMLAPEVDPRHLYLDLQRMH